MDSKYYLYGNDNCESKEADYLEYKCKKWMPYLKANARAMCKNKHLENSKEFDIN